VDPGLAILRTFSKAYGLAALRVGCLYAPLGLAIAVARTGIPFAVGSLARRAAEISLGKHAEVLRRASEVVAERDRVEAEIRSLGVNVTHSHGNFVWLAAGALASPLAEDMLRHGVETRHYAGEGIRATLGTSSENDLFVEMLRSALSRTHL